MPTHFPPQVSSGPLGGAIYLNSYGISIMNDYYASSKVPYYRIGSVLIDLAVSGIPTIGFFLDQSLNHQGVIDPSVIFAINLFCIVVLATVISGVGSLGDILLKMRAVDVITGVGLKKSKLLLRSLGYWYAIIMISISYSDSDHSVFYVWLSILAIGFLIMFSSNNKYKSNMTLLDVIFKTKVIKVEKSQMYEVNNKR